MGEPKRRTASLDRALTAIAIRILEEELPLEATLAQLRNEAVRLALTEYDGNVSRAARALGMDRTTFRRAARALTRT